jgi:hypothetical protein
MAVSSLDGFPIITACITHPSLPLRNRKNRFIGKKASWEHPADGRKLSFNEVEQLLRTRTEDLLRTHPSVREVSIVVLDFRPPILV